MSMSEPNPYEAAVTDSGEAAEALIGKGAAVAGMIVSYVFASLYLLVCIAAVYEVWRFVARPFSLNVSYVVEGTLAGAFLVLCWLAARRFKARRRVAIRYLVFAPLLLVIWIYPGTFAVIKFCCDLVGL